jgi:hypothetical protein
VLTRCSFAPIPSPIPRWHPTLFALLASRPAFGLRLFRTDSASTLPFSRLAQCSFPLWSRCSLIPPSETFVIGGFALCRCQHPTLRLLPAGATVAGWVILLPLDQRALSTAHAKCGLKVRPHKKLSPPRHPPVHHRKHVTPLEKIRIASCSLSKSVFSFLLLRMFGPAAKPLGKGSR